MFIRNSLRYKLEAPTALEDMFATVRADYERLSYDTPVRVGWVDYYWGVRIPTGEAIRRHCNADNA